MDIKCLYVDESGSRVIVKSISYDNITLPNVDKSLKSYPLKMSNIKTAQSQGLGRVRFSSYVRLD